MNIWVNAHGDLLIVGVSGVVDSRAAGPLYDTLVGCSRHRGARLIVDLGGVTRLTRAGVRGLLVAARLVRQGGGTMRICGAGPEAASLLADLGFRSLVTLDADRAAAVAAIARDMPRVPPAQSLAAEAAVFSTRPAAGLDRAPAAAQDRCRHPASRPAEAVFAPFGRGPGDAARWSGAGR
ncbi:STAS domain-containing protein [Acuticoccus sediminis]|uniref:STAS domain-containing protein n=1 Tax=Acuticoccus sediminis TaxID=2184697 RepID=UPI001CFDCFC9|nr:STAS domain-containing protein [Acuticoccus sediminis]